MKFNRNILIVAIMLFCTIATNAKTVDTRRQLFDFGWRFSLTADDKAKRTNFDDSHWRQIDLPHDWSIEGSVNRNNPAGNDGGYFPTGTGWYRKTFTMPSSAAGRKTWLYFEGVYERSEVYVNGIKVGGHPYGYTSFFCDITAAVKPGRKNVVAVKADNSQQKNCRWYSGSGIYRHVWLVTADPMHILNHGVFITTPTTNRAKVSVSIANESKAERTATLKIDLGGLGYATQTVTVGAGDTLTVTKEIGLSNQQLWSTDSPNLYTADIELANDGKPIDKVSQTFGVRTVSYSAKGFWLNGKSMKLYGCCVHHDNGILGAASFDRAEERKAELIKKAGFNAVRTSHNPPSEAFLDACDRIGLLVIDESFDGWRMAKNKYDYSTLFDQWWYDDVTAMVRRDRNHPSIFCWSVGNEVIERKKIEIVTTAHKLAKAVKEWDGTRPVTSALAAWDKDWEIYDPLAAEMDIVGYNYMIHKAPSDHQRVPERVMMQTESYPKDAFKNWAMMADHPYVIGDFVWTGIDYLGESGIGRYWYDGETPGEHYHRPLYPWHGAYCGDVDLTGWRKPISHYRSILSGVKGEKMYMAVKEPDGYRGKIRTGLWAVWPTWESWNWEGYEGKPIDVEVYSRHQSVRLYLNDKFIGEQTTDRAHEFKATFTLPYAAGTLRAEAIDDGKVVETHTLATADKPAVIKTTVDRPIMAADGQDLAYVTVELTDKNGIVTPNADNTLTFSVSGPAVIEATGNANLQDTHCYKKHECKAWKGRALAVVRSSRKAGAITLTVTSPGMKTVKVKIKSDKR